MSTNPITIRAARILLGQLGLTPEDLLWEPVDIATFAEYIPTVAAAAGPGAHRTYGTYWEHIIAAFGHRRLDEVSPTDIEALMRHLVAARRLRRNDRGGHSPGKRYLDWQLEDPAGQGVDAVRPIRDDIDRRVRGLVAELLD